MFISFDFPMEQFSVEFLEMKLHSLLPRVDHLFLRRPQRIVAGLRNDMICLKRTVQTFSKGVH